MSDVELDHEHEVIYASTRVGSTDGESKSNKGEIKYASAKPLQVPIFEMLQLGGRVSVYGDLLEYIEIVRKFRAAGDKYFFVPSTITRKKTFSSARILVAIDICHTIKTRTLKLV